MKLINSEWNFLFNEANKLKMKGSSKKVESIEDERVLLRKVNELEMERCI